MSLGKWLTVLVLVFLMHIGVLGVLQRLWEPVLALQPMAQPLFLHTVVAKAPPAVKTASPSKRTAGALDSHSSAQADLAGQAPVASQSALVPDEPRATPEVSVESTFQNPLNTPAVPDAHAPAAPPDAKPTETATSPWPADTRVSYRMRGYYRGEVYGSAQVQWQRQQERYQVQLDMRMALLFHVSMTSQGTLTEAELLPQVYEEQFLSVRRGVSFDGEQLRLQDGKQIPKPPGVQDTASQFVALSQRFATGRQALALGEVVNIWLARPYGVDLWTYDVTEQVELQTPELGQISAFHLKPRPLARPRGDIVAELWLAPSLQYLPVRVRIALGGDNYVDLTLEKIEQSDPTPAPQKRSP